MAALNINTHHGPKTFKADAPVKAGQFVVPGGKGGVKPAGADADNVLGVAILDASYSHWTASALSLSYLQQFEPASLEVAMELTNKVGYSNI